MLFDEFIFAKSFYYAFLNAFNSITSAVWDAGALYLLLSFSTHYTFVLLVFPFTRRFFSEHEKLMFTRRRLSIDVVYPLLISQFRMIMPIMLGET